MMSIFGGGIPALVSAWLMSGLANGFSMDAWLVDALAAPQLAMYDDASGQILYSLCNSSGTPVFPEDESASFDLKFPPLKGTGVSGFGYVDTKNGVAAQFFYQTDEGAIVDATFYCDSDTGHYIASDRQWIVSTGIGNLPKIRQPSSIQALPVGETSGQRIYFRDEDNQPAVLGYHPDLKTWQFDGYILQANFSTYSGSTAAAILGIQNITLAFALDNDIGISRLGDGNWVLSGVPTPVFGDLKSDQDDDGPVRVTNETSADELTLSYNDTLAEDWSLDEFDSSATNLGLAFSSRGSLSVFYIGDNGVLHQVNQTKLGDQGDDKWQKAEQQGPERWPVADADNSRFAIAHDYSTNQIWIFYKSGGNMKQIHQSSSGVWELAATLEKSNDTSNTATNGEGGDQTASGENSADDNSDGGMPRASRIGLGIGISFGVLFIGSLVGMFSWYYRRRSARNSVAELPGSIRGAATSPGNVPEEQLGVLRQQRYPEEKHGEELFELPLQGQRYEMENTQRHELPQDEVHEMPGDTFLRPQT